jgi:periplasmic protein TonB
MFEDALVESAGRVRTKSRYWMIATFSFQAIVMAIVILIPLLYPEALPRSVVMAKLTVPVPPRAAVPRQVQVVRAVHAAASNPLIVPTTPTKITMVKDDAPPQMPNSVPMGEAKSDGPVGVPLALSVAATPLPMVKVAVKPARQNVSSGVMAGQILTKTMPSYPAIARAAHVYGTVVLHASISKAGTIEGLAVISGPEMLRAAAVEAVKSWRYRPYLLNGEPTEVETTVTVNFSLGG